MATMYYESDGNLEVLEGKTVAVLGYGSQGHAQAQNLRDSGVEVLVGLRKESSSWQVAEEDGFDVYTTAEAAERGDIVQVLIPDEVQAKVYQHDIKPGLHDGNALVFAHGFNIHFGQIQPEPNVDVFMIAPKAPGHLLRRVYREGQGVPALLAVHQDYTGQARELGLAYAAGIGSLRAGVIETTFAEETETDLFGEQTVLCGGVSSLIKTGFETLVEAGYQPEIAYFECLHELKLIVDLIYEGGLSNMRFSVSDTAQFGDITVGPKVINEQTKETMRDVLARIQNGDFARDWILENQANRPRFNALTRMDDNHPLEVTGRRLRAMMSWLKPDK